MANWVAQNNGQHCLGYYIWVNIPRVVYEPLKSFYSPDKCDTIWHQKLIYMRLHNCTYVCGVLITCCSFYHPLFVYKHVFWFVFWSRLFTFAHRAVCVLNDTTEKTIKKSRSRHTHTDGTFWAVYSETRTERMCACVLWLCLCSFDQRQGCDSIKEKQKWFQSTNYLRFAHHSPLLVSFLLLLLLLLFQLAPIIVNSSMLANKCDKKLQSSIDCCMTDFGSIKSDKWFVTCTHLYCSHTHSHTDEYLFVLMTFFLFVR